MEQGTFEFEREKSLDAQFATWADEHKDVLTLFERFARELRSAGHKKAGAKLIWERLRWERMTSAHGTGCPALNNNWTSRLARWLIAKDGSFNGFFELRELKS